MFAHQNKEQTQVGDTILLYAGRGRVVSIDLAEGETYCHQFGAFRHDDLIGIPYGSRVQSSTKSGAPGRGYCYVLRPDSPDIWCTGPLDHHTQIIYPIDISQICFHLELCPGKRVIESGTGSGSLSLGFARCLYPTGRLDTFEFHEDRKEATQKHFKKLGLDSIIYSHRRDVVSDGFDVPDGCADAVFLDLPSPWSVVEEANRCLNEEGNFCSFSPCIEQIQRTCDKLRELKFEDIRVVECLIRPIDVFPRESDALDLEKKRQSDKQFIVPTQEAQEDESMSDASELCELGKRKREEEGNGNNESKGGEVTQGTPIIDSQPKTQYSSKIKRFSDLGSSHQVVSRPTSEIKGHTSYLLFARKSLGNLAETVHKESQDTTAEEKCVE